ncbi:FTSH extracellular protease family protein [Trifolium medium]|uniref:FTSH extracellular protease family protein n=1 Tax=Trifolium medium TaxID=97028 RepID=A0A392N7C6_9FABA|nr:FTSH extracellular protease family protein [Trifolium medium]
MSNLSLGECGKIPHRLDALSKCSVQWLRQSFPFELAFMGVLIAGERGAGKTSLALAIAAEAKVPVVEIKAHQLEAGLWVGQGASNVRELFQTARDLVILFKPP